MCKSMVTIKHVKLENPLVGRERLLLMLDVVKLSHCTFTVSRKEFTRNQTFFFFIDKTKIVKQSLTIMILSHQYNYMYNALINVTIFTNFSDTIEFLSISQSV